MANKKVEIDTKPKTAKEEKEQQMPVKELTKNQSKVPTETKTKVPSSAKVNDGEAKAEKVKEAKMKKQVAVEPVTAEVVAIETAPVSKKGTPEPTSEKATKMKRLTLDIAKPLHKAIKAKAVEEGIPMVDMLRSLLEKHYSK